jgi:RNase H-fold protein (predicted Holliday junction resolvase)
MSGIHSIPEEVLDLIWSFIDTDFYSRDIRRTCKALERVSRKTFMDTFMYKGSLPIVMDELDLGHAMELSTSVCRTSITSAYIFSCNWATKKDLQSQVYWVPENLTRVDRTVFPQIMSFQENQAKIRETNSDVEMLATIIKNLDCQEITIGLPNFRDGDWRGTYSIRKFNRLLQENGAPPVYYMMARNTLNHVGQIFGRVLAATRAAERDVEVAGVAISSAHPPERRTEDFEDGVQKYIAFHRALLKDVDVSFEVQLRLKPIVAGFSNPKSLHGGSQSHFLTKLFRTAEYLKLDTPLRCALRDTVPFGEFTNLRRLHLRSLYLGNDPA